MYSVVSAANEDASLGVVASYHHRAPAVDL